MPYSNIQRPCRTSRGFASDTRSFFSKRRKASTRPLVLVSGPTSNELLASAQACSVRFSNVLALVLKMFGFGGLHSNNSAVDAGRSGYGQGRCGYLYFLSKDINSFVREVSPP